MKKIAFIPHKKRVEKHKLDYLRAIADTMDDPYQAEDGREVRGVQLELANKCANLSGIPYWTFTDCCTDSLQIAVTTLTNIGDSILVPAYGWRAFANAPVFMGRQVRFVDCDETGNMDMDKAIEGLEKEQWGQIKAVIVVHNFGTVANTKKIWKTCKEKNIAIIEDAAPSFYMGEPYDYVPGSLADITCYSFDFTKGPGCLGSGGGLATHDNDLYNIIYQIQAHGTAKDHSIVRVGTKSFLDMTSCAVLLKEIELYEQHNYRERRRQIASFYLDNLPYTNIAGDNYIWERYTMSVSRNEVDSVLKKLHDAGCLARIMFKQPLTQFEWVNPNEDKCPETENFVNSIIHIPSHHYMEEWELETIKKALN